MLLQAVEDKWIAGAVGFIARDGKIIYNRAFGESDIENRMPIQTDNIFRIASQTKAITSVAVMMLYEEGRISLNDPISRYLPEFGDQQVISVFNKQDSVPGT